MATQEEPWDLEAVGGDGKAGGEGLEKEPITCLDVCKRSEFMHVLLFPLSVLLVLDSQILFRGKKSKSRENVL
jgi:hypothetical protein